MPTPSPREISGQTERAPESQTAPPASRSGAKPNVIHLEKHDRSQPQEFWEILSCYTRPKYPGNYSLFTIPNSSKTFWKLLWFPLSAPLPLRGWAGTGTPTPQAAPPPGLKQVCWSLPSLLCSQAKLPLNESFHRNLRGKSLRAGSYSWRADVSELVSAGSRGGRAVRTDRACPPLPATRGSDPAPRHGGPG